MYKTVFISLLMMGFATTAFSQDQIYLKKGGIISAIVIEVDVETIKYKKSGNVNGPSYNIRKDSIEQIVYENGSRDEFAGDVPETEITTGNEVVQEVETFTYTDFNNQVTIPKEARIDAVWNLTSGGGYSSVGFIQVKDACYETVLNERQAFLDLLYYIGSYGSAQASVSDVGHAWSVFDSVFRKISPVLQAGVKLEYLSINQIRAEVKGRGGYNESYSYKMLVDSSLLSVLGGIKFGTEKIPQSVAWSASIMIGPAFSFSNISVDGTVAIPAYYLYDSIHYSVPYYGEGIRGDINIGLEYCINRNFGINLNMGYHLCEIPRVTAKGTVDINRDGTLEVSYGDALKDADGKTLKIDYSGVDVRAGINVGF